MHIHILGVCGTFMGGVAQLAVEAGHKVTGCDAGVYPPMSEALSAAGIELIEGYDEGQLAIKPDCWVVGNAVSRGNPLLEAILDAGERYTSGPQWLAEHVLVGRHVMAVAGTHGKTTTSAMLAHILCDAGLEAGFLIGGVPAHASRSAALGVPQAPFVIEADEYDTCFCDKRSKFVHYRPRTAILNNLEFDHADIFECLDDIERQFHHLLRTMPRKGLVISHADCDALERVLARGLFSRLERFDTPSGWSLSDDATVAFCGRAIGRLDLPMPGRYNRLNAVAALAAARNAGVAPEAALEALSRFGGVRRRQEVRGVENDVVVVDDFAHHPTAIAETIGAVRERWPNRRIVAVLEPRSNTMKLGTMKERLADSLAGADRVFAYAGRSVHWDLAAALAPLGEKASVTHDFDALLRDVLAQARPGDVLLCMSNGAFGGIHAKLLAGLKGR